ncbi:hypothetical protein COV06_03115 [Candidatus Uhrbacteria bacterium CG10_big_fil_rev_8_21_14_0_10_50_16]|uniref:Uncharacterized protein n=1 Tax=Candidatus Uhrbacteria bacterium CG10_big_fil_rev_8_21_14_0_10_50_16 TaxID=1975039 RepID=A0A2H0RLP8_9BACT|nr:MAG: hypothetical protein COV06_03115 [Candidatus Uhrbacteria bacterium CG10_big_fil_rev_8_21_14_0_10_50_16]
MYRYRDNYLDTQQSARPWIRWAAVVLYLLLVGYLAITWIHQGNAIPNASSSIGGAVTLPEDDYAIAIFFNTDQKELLFNVTGLVGQAFAVKNDGSIVSINQMVPSAPRPPAWFLPTTVGVVYVREGDTVTTRRLFRIKNGIAVSMPGQKAIQIPIHPNATIGIHCSNNCSIPGTSLVLPEGLDLISTDHQLMIATDAKNRASFMQFIYVSSKQQNPIERDRLTNDGRTISELVPADTIDTIITDEALQTHYTGGTTFGWYYQINEDRDVLLASTSTDLLNEYTSEMSTATWTNTICEKHPVSFYRYHSLPMLEENTQSTYTLVRSINSWRICAE